MSGAEKRLPSREAATLALDAPVTTVKGVSPARAKALEALGVSTVRDLVGHFPRRYIDLSDVRTVASASIGASCTICGTVHEAKLKRPKPRLSLTEVTLVDATGTLMVTCFRQPWLAEQLKPGMAVAVAGKVEFDFGFKRMTNPFVEVMGEGAGEGPSGEGVGAIIPVHPASEKLSAAWVRRLVREGLGQVRSAFDPLPLEERCRYRLMSRGQAWECIHFPATMAEAREARRRLAYEELLLLELHLMMESQAREAGASPVAHVVDGPRMQALAAALPFALTDEQAQARDELLAAMASPHAANHLLLGDVGTGKTAVAVHALAAAADSGGQALFMAPTEVLARQHAEGLGPWLDQAGLRFGLLTGSTPAHERAEVLARLAAGELDVLFGTHALLEPEVAPASMTLAVIDEQQRFGVDQRSRLLEKGSAPDALFLTATPIPRSLALALFGNFTLSYLRRGPKQQVGRTTRVLAKQDIGQAYEAARAALARGERVYVVCPLIGVSSEERDGAAASKRSVEAEEAYHPVVAIEDDGDLPSDNAAAAEQEAAFLQAKIFGEHQVDLLHGQMSAADKQAVMDRFRAGETQVLVATTVIEVGVDVPAATVMVIQDADRFGLSQLHQLRGRVGRGSRPGEVFLVSASQQEPALARLRAMETTDDGYELATYDLSLRREGDIVGNRQSGASSLKLVNVVRDGAIIEAAQRDARALLEADPGLTEHRALAREVRLLFGSGAVTGG